MDNYFVFCDKAILTEIKSIPENARFSTGLIIGQSLGKGVSSLIHITSTNIFDNEEECWKPYQFYEPGAPKDPIVDHAKYVYPMLSGGSNILGIFFAGDSEMFDNKQNIDTIKDILYSIRLITKGDEIQSVLFYNTSVKRFTFMIVNEAGVFNQVNIVTSDTETNWFEVTTTLNLSQLPLFTITKKEFSHKVEEFCEQLRVFLEDTAISINNNFFKQDHLLINVGEDETIPASNENQKVFEAKIFKKSSEGHDDEVCSFGHGHVSLSGVLSSVVYCHENSTIGFVEKALKEDIIRSVRKRLQLYWGRKEETNFDEDVEVVQCLPRRILFTPRTQKCSYSFYIFEENEVDEILPLIKIFLNFDAGYIYEMEEDWGNYNIQIPTRRNISAETLEEIRPYYLTKSAKADCTMNLINELELCHKKSTESPKKKKFFNKFGWTMTLAASVAVLSIIIYIYQ